MKASWEKTEKNQGVLTVETDEATFENALDRAFKKVRTKVNVPGFRRGKVPRKIFESRFGVEALYQEALDLLLPDVYEQAVKETGIEPVDRPEIDIEQLEKGKSLIFKATVTVKPEVKLGQYRELEIEEKEFNVTDEDVENELKNMQKQQGQLEAVEDGEVQNGDHIIFDFEGFVDGEPFEGGKAEKYNLEVGSGTFIPGFEEQLLGLKPDEEKEIHVTFPEDYNAKDLAGKPAVFKVKLHEIKRLDLPELDDEFAQDVSEFDTLEELKADIRKNLTEKAEQDKENYVREQVVELASANAEVDIPAAMIQHEIDHMLHQFEHQLSFQGLSLDKYKEFTGMDDEALREQFKEDAEKKVKRSLVLEAIAKAEKIEVTEEDLDQEVKQMAEQMQREEEEIRKLIDAQGGIEGIKEQLLVKKTIDLLVLSSKNAA